jgi:hypothetical protein
LKAKIVICNKREKSSINFRAEGDALEIMNYTEVSHVDGRSILTIEGNSKALHRFLHFERILLEIKLLHIYC